MIDPAIVLCCGALVIATLTACMSWVAIDNSRIVHRSLSQLSKELRKQSAEQATELDALWNHQFQESEWVREQLGCPLPGVLSRSKGSRYN